MFNMFKLECKRIIKNPIFYIISILIILFCVSQLGLNVPPEKVAKPLEGQESYGEHITSDMEIIKPKAVEKLISEYISNDYVTYPYGFYKVIHLSDNKEKEIGKIISSLTGKSLESIEQLKDKNKFSESTLDVDYIKIKEALTDEQFIEIMNLANAAIGKGGLYGEENLKAMFGKTERTYKDALEDYNLIIEKDKISGAYARYFADYMGIVLAVLPVFLAANLWFLDKKSKSQDILYVREIKSRDLVWSRYLSMVFTICTLSLALATYYNIDNIIQFGIGNIDMLAYYKYTIVWLIPTLMFSLALGTLLTIATDTLVAIIAQLIWFFLDTGTNYESIKGGGYGMSLILRHNTIGNTLGYVNNVNQILINRLVYVVIALVMVALAERIYDKKRTGKLGGVNGFRKVK